MATVRSKNGKLFIDYRINGKRKREFLKLEDNRENKKIAEIRRKEIELDLASGLLGERVGRMQKRVMRLSNGLTEFLETKEELREKTKANYRQAMEKLIKFAGDIPISMVTPEMVKEIRIKMKKDKYL
jgi:hypothetical protein